MGGYTVLVVTRKGLRSWALGLCMLWLLTHPGSAQVAPRLERIQQEFSRVTQQARQVDRGGEPGQHGPLYVNELVVNRHERPWPAVGIHRLRYRFYYDHESGEGGREPRPLPDRLRLVDLEVEISARRAHFSFLYDKAGQLMLWRREADQEKLELCFVEGRQLGRASSDGRKALAAAQSLRKLFLDSLQPPLVWP